MCRTLFPCLIRNHHAFELKRFVRRPAGQATLIPIDPDVPAFLVRQFILEIRPSPASPHRHAAGPQHPLEQGNRSILRLSACFHCQLKKLHVPFHRFPILRDMGRNRSLLITILFRLCQKLGCVSKVVEIGFGASPGGLSFAAVRPRGQGFRRRLADRGFPIHRLCASGFGRKRGAPRGASALFRDTAARSVF